MEESGKNLVAKLNGFKPSARKEALLKILKTDVALALGYESEADVDSSRGFMDMGMDSIIFLEFLNRLRKRLGDDYRTLLNTTLLFNYPSVDELLEYLLAEIFKGAGKDQGNAEAAKVQPKKQKVAEEEDTGGFDLVDYPADAIAITGMACRLPGGISSPNDLWDALVNKKDLVGSASDARWQLGETSGDGKQRPDKQYLNCGGYLKDIEKFDPLFFGISPREAIAIDPQQRLLMETSWEALEDAGETLKSLRATKTGVYVGVTFDDYLALIRESDLENPAQSGIEAHVPTGNCLNAMAGRLSYFYGLLGPAMAVDTACSSSLVATHLAVQDLKLKKTDRAIVAGVNIILKDNVHDWMTKAHALSKSGRCKTFDESADGYVRSEGIGVIVLKRLADAVKNHDNILAVIRGTAVNQNGRSTSLTAPNGLSQQVLIQDALAQGSLKPEEISYMEAHGTGTPLGDPIEVQAIVKALCKDRKTDNPLLLGTLKANIGHAESAAGLAGIVKTIQCIRNKKIPGQVHFNNLNKNINIEGTGIQIPKDLTNWEPKSGRRIAGVSSFGFSGTNAHVVLDQAPKKSKITKKLNESNLLLLSAKTKGSLRELNDKYLKYLAEANSSFEDLCYTSCSGRNHFPHRLSIVAKDKASAASALKAIKLNGARFKEASDLDRQRAFKAGIFVNDIGPELASSIPDFFGRYQSFKAAFEAAASAVNQQFGMHLDITTFSLDSQDKLLEKASKFVALYAYLKMWIAFGLKPSLGCGSRMGKIALLVAFDSIDLVDAVKILAILVELESEAPRSQNDVEDSDIFKQHFKYLKESDFHSTGFSLFGAADGVDQADEYFKTDQFLSDTIFENPSKTEIQKKFSQNGIYTILDFSTGFNKLSGESDKELQVVSGAGDIQSVLMSLGALYEIGMAIEPDAIYYKELGYKTVSLPTYQFQKESYWVVAGERKVEHSSADLHLTSKNASNLLGERIRFSKTGEIEFMATYSAEKYPLLGHHRVYHNVIVPGAAHLSRVLLASKQIYDGMVGQIEEVEFIRPIVLDENEQRSAKLLFTYDGNESYSFQISSKGSDDSDWSLNAMGRLVPSPVKWGTNEEKGENVEDIRSKMKVIADSDAYVEFLDKMGYQYGRGFMWFDKVMCGGQDVLCRLRGPDNLDEIDGYIVHPGLLDVWFQSADGYFFKGKGTTPPADAYVPVQLDKLRFYRSPVGPIWCHLTFETPTGTNEKNIKSHIKVTDENGYLVAEVSGFVMRQAPKESLLKPSASQGKAGARNDQFEVRWEKSEWQKSAQDKVAGQWLVFGDNTGFGKQVEESLVHLGDKVRFAKYSDDVASEIQNWVASGAKLKGILHTRSLDIAKSEIRSTEDLLKSQNTGYLQVLNLCQKLLATGDKVTFPTFVITSGSRSIGDFDKIGLTGPAQSTIFGLGRVLELEHPELDVRFIDLDPNAAESANQISNLTGEIAQSGEDRVVVFRKSERFVPRLVEADFNGVPEFALKSSGACIITGGLGGLGIQVAKWLISRGAKSLVLVGRSKPSSAALKEIEAMEAMGAKVSVESADVADRESVAKMVRNVSEKFGSIAGIVHAAGTLSSATIIQQDWNKFKEVFNPKAIGMWNLHLATEKMPLEFFVGFSSLSSVLGSPGLANYAGANTFLESFAQFRRSIGLVGSSVAWGPWAEVGMAAALTTSQQKQLSDSGMDTISPQNGLNSLGRVMASSKELVAVLPMRWDRYITRVFTDSGKRFLTHVVGEKKVKAVSPAAPTDSAGQGSVNLGLEIERTPLDGRVKVIKKYLTKEIADLLKVGSSQQIDPQKGLMDLGMDSIMAIEFRTRLKKAVGGKFASKIPAALVFNYPTVDSLSEFVLSLFSAVAWNKDAVANEAKVEKPSKAQSVADSGPAPSAKTMVSVSQAADPRETDIAIVGMSCRFPGGVTDPNTFWELLIAGREAITEVPRSRWNADEYFSKDPDAQGKTYATTGGFLDNIDQFDAQLFDLSPRETVAIDPQQRILLEEVWTAIENSGESISSVFGSQTGVFVGVMRNEYEEIIRTAKDSGRLEAYIATGNTLSAASGRISFHFGLQGPCLAIDTACSSSLVAVHTACESLRSRDCDRAIAAGVNLNLTPDDYIQLSRMRALSVGGHCNAFDQSADGYVRSEGVGVIVLKRLSDALKNNDNILAVIKGSAVNQDGRSSSLTAPNGKSQEALIKRALERASVNPVEVGYVEAHGTGTPLGDPIEFHAMMSAYCQDRDKKNPLVIGAVKSNIGHTESAAGMASIIKTILAMKSGVIPPNINLKKVNEEIPLSEYPAELPTQAVQWKTINGRRLAGISSFGITGTNAHVILEDVRFAEPEKAVSPQPTPNVLFISAKSPSVLEKMVDKYLAWFTANPDVNLESVCFASATGRSHFASRLALVASNVEDAIAGLQAFKNGEWHEGLYKSEPETNGQLESAFLFTGQGSQYVGMAKDLYAHDREFKRNFDECAKILNSKLKVELTQLVFGSAGEGGVLNETINSQPALFAIEYSLAKTWIHWGLKPSYLIGHSVGELAAACVAGVFSLEDGLSLISSRAKLMGELSKKGGMYSVMAEFNVVEPLLKNYPLISVAAVNGPKSTVISGDFGELSALVGQLEKMGLRAKKLEVSNAFHSDLMTPMLDAFKAIASQVKFSAPQIPIISNLTGKIAGEEICTPEYWTEHIRKPVLYYNGIQSLLNEGVTLFLEVGPSATLASLGEDCAGDRKGITWLSSLKKGKKDVKCVRDAIGAVHALGVNLNWSTVFPNTSNLKKVALPTYQFDRQRYWIEGLEETTGSSNLGCEIKLEKVERPQGQQVANHRYVVLSDEPAAGRALAAEIERKSQQVILIEAEDPAQAMNRLEKVLTDSSSTGNQKCVVVDFRRGVAARDSANMPEQFKSSCFAGVEVLKAVQKNIAAVAKIVVMKKGVWVHEGSKNSDALVNSWLFGLARTSSVECPDLDFKVIDLADETGGISPEQVKFAAGELMSADGEDFVVFKENQRFAARLVPRKLGPPKEIKIDPNAAYLISGGLSGIGLQSAKWLVERGSRNLLLIGRSAPSEEAKAAIAEMSVKGAKVEIWNADIASHEGIELITKNLKNLKASLKGVIHAAGVLSDGLLANLSNEKFEAVLKPKLHGAWNLHSITKHIELDFFVLYSSLASAIGSVGQSNYAAANSFMDSLARWKRNNGVNAVSINWGPWGKVGMASKLNESQVRELTKSGIEFLADDEAFKSLESCIQAGLPQMVISRVNWQKYFDTNGGLRGRKFFVKVSTGSKDVVKNESTKAILLSGSRQNKLNTLISLLKDSVANVMDLNVSAISSNVDLRTLGISSIMAVELRNLVLKTLGSDVRIPVNFFFAHPFLEEAAALLLEQVENVRNPSANQPRDKANSDQKIWAGKIKGVGSRPEAAVRMFCIHHAGGSGQVFKKWGEMVSPKIEVCSIELPGRWSDVGVTPFDNMSNLVESLYNQIKGALDKKFVFVGYSFGSLISYELTRKVYLEEKKLPVGLYAVACRAPHLKNKSESISSLTDEQFLNRIKFGYGQLDSGMEDKEVRDLVLPVLRADFKLMESYHAEERTSFDFPITTIAGSKDAIVSSELIAPWGELTTGRFRHIAYDCDHFVLHSHFKEFLKLVETDLTSVA